MTLDEPIQIVEYNHVWATYFVDEKNRLCGVLKQEDKNIEHIGSTAVIGLESKPIIDLMLGVFSFPPSQMTTSTIMDLGYENFGEAGVPDRLYFRCRGSVAINIHVTQFRGELWRTNLAVRDFLRSHPPACDSYTKVKRQAVESGNKMLLAYSNAKADYVNRLVTRALQWRDANKLCDISSPGPA